jgi:hypothetical protein
MLIKCLEEKSYIDAAHLILSAPWASKIGFPIERLSKVMREGVNLN